MATNSLPPIHPGEIIREDVLPSAGLSPADAAELLGLSPDELHPILAGRAPLSADLCGKLSARFGSSPAMWQRLQAEYDRKAAPPISRA